MYVVKTPMGFVGPFKTNRSIDAWLKQVPATVATNCSKHVILEPLEWNIFTDVIPGLAIERTTMTGSTSQSKTKPSEQK